MYSLCVVELKPSGELGLLERERYALVPVVSNTLCLYGAVKPLDVGIVVGAMDSGVAYRHAIAVEHLFEIAPILRAVVGLDHRDGILPAILFTPVTLCREYHLGRSPWTELGTADGVREPREEIDHSVVIQSSSSAWINMVNRVGFN